MEYNIKFNSIEWKPGQIKGFLSKEIFDQENGCLKLIRVEPQSTYPLHKHVDKTEYAIVLEGNPEIIIENNYYTGVIGDVFIFPSNAMHAISNNSSDHCTLIIGSIKNSKKS